MYIYDNPLLFFNSDVGIEKMTEIKNNSIIKFVKPICISKIEPKYWAWLFNNKTIRGFKNSLYGIEDDPYWMEFYEWIQDHHTPGNIKITIKTKTGKVETLKNKEGRFMETIDLKEMTKEQLTTLLQKKIFQLGMNGLQQNDIMKVINEVEKELARRKEANISQANTQKEENKQDGNLTQSAQEDSNEQ